MKVLICASEGTPFVKTGGLADVIGALPKILKKEGIDVRVVLPYYKKIKDNNNANYRGYCYVRIGESNEYAGVFHQVLDGIDYYFIDSNKYFDREGLYGYSDDGERFAFYDFAILEMLKVIDFFPDIIHNNDWQTGLIPYILNANYYGDIRYKYIKTLYSIHNIQYQGWFGNDLMKKLFIPYSKSLEFNYGISFMKAAIMESTIVNTVSNTYREEVLHTDLGYGLNQTLQYREKDFYGILNGLDTDKFNPSTDPNLFVNYDITNYKEKKEENKKALLKQFGLSYEPDSMLFGLVSRLADQKGIDLLFTIMDTVIKNTKAKFILMGSGDRHLENYFRSLEYIYPDRFKCYVGYSDPIAMRIYAGADCFLMPSKFEPCGLGQMISMRYGTLPLVRETGGLKDTVRSYNKFTHSGNGFSFTNFIPNDLKEVMILVDQIYRFNREDFDKMIVEAMKEDFSWTQSAKKYIELYEKALNKGE